MGGVGGQGGWLEASRRGFGQGGGLLDGVRARQNLQCAGLFSDLSTGFILSQ